MSTPVTAPDRRPAATAAELGVGARFSLHPASDDAVRVILDALARVGREDVTVTTDDVSTLVRGSESAVVRYVHDVLAAAGRHGVHVAAHVQLSRGCPGEVACALPDDVVLSAVAAPDLPRTGLRAAAHWALYPLDDGTPGHPGDHMRAIEQAIAVARARASVSASHFVTRLDGDLADVLGAVADAWLAAARHVRHVVAHVTITLHSPSWDPGTPSAAGTDASGAASDATEGTR
ncbi:Ykof family thiamine-binding protein [Cellulomonas fimi]|uniref:YkoF family thiamine/hydroxymethylpyrimidine-binding protein n=1 Tax=Cellulomonas fimi TaxID=1708 RepID=UPI00234D6B86|nr:YkoF family thiamine/hydroxymethylpyrimidine-binding protein [Cellulomonas fimi]MDC7121022.1 Ykof family thiamine-binding protein [Cellulomonas fimi]